MKLGKTLGRACLQVLGLAWLGQTRKQLWHPRLLVWVWVVYLRLPVIRPSIRLIISDTRRWCRAAVSVIRLLTAFRCGLIVWQLVIVHLLLSLFGCGLSSGTRRRQAMLSDLRRLTRLVIPGSEWVNWLVQ